MDTTDTGPIAHPLLMREYARLPLAALTLDSALVSFIAPHVVALHFVAATHELNTWQAEDDSLAGCHILAGDVLIYATDRTAPVDGAIQFVEAGDGFAFRVCRVLADDWIEFHPAAEGYPILSGERRVYGTLSAVVRATERVGAGER